MQRWLARVGVSSAVVLSSVASGVWAPTQTHAEPAVEAAREQFRVGLEEANRGNWQRALAAFTLAYQSAPEPTVLLNLASAQARCGKLLASTTNYRRVLASADAGLTRAERSLIEQQIARVEARIPRLRVQVTGLRSDDRLLLDKSRIYPDELERDLWVDPGPHLIQVVRARGRPETRTLVVVEGEVHVISLTLAGGA